MVDKGYNEAYMKSTHKKWFSENFKEDYNKTESFLKLDINYTISIYTYYSMSNENLIYFSRILDKLGTDEQLLYDEIPEDIARSYRSTKDLSGQNKSEIVEAIVLMRDGNDQIMVLVRILIIVKMPKVLKI